MNPAANGEHRLDKRAVRRAFEQAVERYDEVAVLQREVGSRLLERLDYVRLTPEVVLDVGAGTGVATAALARQYPKGRVLALDLAPAMLRRARRRRPWFRKMDFIAGDAEHLPLADASCDLVFSNVAVQWCNDLARALTEFRRVLRPGGLLMFTTFGLDTLHELRQCWSRADGFSHVSAFPDMHDIGDSVLRAGFADPVMDTERFTLTYPDVRTLMRELKAIGAHNATAGRPRGLTGRQRLQAVADAYEHFRRDGVLPATYEVVYGHGWVPHTTRPGEVVVPLSEFGGLG